MRASGLRLREQPIRLVELGSPPLLTAAATLSASFVAAAFCYSLAALLLISLLYSFLNQGRP